MTGERLDVLCAADMCVDLVLKGNVRPRFGQVEQLIEDYSIELGGSANIFASQFAKLGGSAGVLGFVGNDALGGIVLEKLTSLGVDTTRVRRHTELKTGLGVALTEPADRAILTYLGTIDATEPAVLCPSLVRVFRHWHIASYFLLSKLRPCWPGWLRACKQAGLTTSLDTNWDPEERWAGVLELLPHVDIFFPNEAEALAISGESTVMGAGEKLAALGPLVVVKRGGRGAVAFGRRSWAAEGMAAAAIPIVDTIGAGDNFDAGFLRGWLLGRSTSDCLELAQRCAVQSLGAPGGIEGQLKEKIF